MLRKLLFFVLFMVLTSFSINALDYSVQVSSPSSVNDYEGDVISDKFSFTITNNGDFCPIECTWATTAGNDGGIKAEPNGGESSKIYFKVKADGMNGLSSYNLIITCDRISDWNCWSDEDQRNLGPYNFNYLWNGDGACTTNREKCASYQTYLKDSSCTCSSKTECNPSSGRDTDSKGCATYCGNGVEEKAYEFALKIYDLYQSQN